MNLIICLSGGIASGKTTVAQTLAEHFTSVSVRSFGDVVRRRALLLGKQLDRESLQALGLEFVAAGWQSFVDALLDDLDESTRVLIVEGVRHHEAVEELRRRTLADKFFTVYIKIDPDIQEKRLQERGEPIVGRAHATESSLQGIEFSADLVVDGSIPAEEIARKIITCVQ